jgi:hypothetical protein
MLVKDMLHAKQTADLYEVLESGVILGLWLMICEDTQMRILASHLLFDLQM